MDYTKVRRQKCLRLLRRYRKDYVFDKSDLV